MIGAMRHSGGTQVPHDRSKEDHRHAQLRRDEHEVEKVHLGGGEKRPKPQKPGGLQTGPAACCTGTSFSQTPCVQTKAPKHKGLTLKIDKNCGPQGFFLV